MNTTYIENCDHIYGFMWRKRIAADCKSFRERERDLNWAWVGFRFGFDA